jgi:hypothetical protein
MACVHIAPISPGVLETQRSTQALPMAGDSPPPPPFLQLPCLFSTLNIIYLILCSRFASLYQPSSPGLLTCKWRLGSFCATYWRSATILSSSEYCSSHLRTSGAAVVFVASDDSPSVILACLHLISLLIFVQMGMQRERACHAGLHCQGRACENCLCSAAGDYSEAAER